MLKDALNDDIVIGGWYGYSALNGGFSHVTFGKIESINLDTGKVRLVDCKVRRFLYGEDTDFKKNKKPGNVNIRSNVLFRIPDQINPL